MQRIGRDELETRTEQGETQTGNRQADRRTSELTGIKVETDRNI